MPKTATIPGLERKDRTFELKSFGGDEPGSHPGFEGIGGVFLNVDSYGDIIDRGAFNEGIHEFLKSGFVGGLNHDWDNPIGHPAEARETTEGLFFRAVLDDTPIAETMRAMMRPHPETGRATIRKLSIGFTVPEGGAERLADAKAVADYWAARGYTPSDLDARRVAAAYTPRRGKDGKSVTPGIRLLRKINLHEVSPVGIPANERAEILSAKAAGRTHFAEQAQEAAAWAVLGQLHDMLCWALYSMLGDDRLDLDERLDGIRDIIDDFRDATVRFIGLILRAEDVEADDASAAIETMAAKFRARFRIPAPGGADDPSTGLGVRAAPALALANQSRQVESTVGDFATRAVARYEARLKEGRALSDANRRAISEVHEGLVGHAGTLKEILDRTQPALAAEGDPAPPTTVALPGGDTLALGDAAPKAGPTPAELRAAQDRISYHLGRARRAGIEVGSPPTHP